MTNPPPSETPASRRFATGAMILLGCLLILGGIYADYERDEFLRIAQTTMGTVFYIEKVRRDDDTPSYHTTYSHYPWIQFFDTQNREFRFRGQYGPSQPEYKIGARLSILYDPQNPQIARID